MWCIILARQFQDPEKLRKHRRGCYVISENIFLSISLVYRVAKAPRVEHLRGFLDLRVFQLIILGGSLIPEDVCVGL